MNLDTFLFNFVYKAINSSTFFKFISSFLAYYLVYFLFIVLIFYLLFKRKNLKEKIFLFLSILFIIIVSRFIFIFILRYFVNQESPLIALHIDNGLLPYHFISFAVAFFVSMAFLFSKWSKKLSYVFGGSAFLVGISEVGIGLKWPSDILLGVIVGIITFIVYKKVFNFE